MLLTQPAALATEEIIRAHRHGVWHFLGSIGCDAALVDVLAQAWLLVRQGARFGTWLKQ
jgi:hypothetical protein